jgi:sulfate adenylyltransferase subunit 1
VQHGTAVTKAIVKSIEATLDFDVEAGGVPRWVDSSTLGLNDVGRVRLALASPLPIDDYREQRTTGAFIVVDADDGWTLAAGMAGPSPLNTPSQTPIHPPKGT